MADLKGKYAKLAEDLRAALECGMAAERENPEDGGTCNFDAASICLPRWRKELVKQAAKEAGTVCRTWNCAGTRYVFQPRTKGQANARCRNAKAMTRALHEMGYDAMCYYAMD